MLEQSPAETPDQYRHQQRAEERPAVLRADGTLEGNDAFGLEVVQALQVFSGGADQGRPECGTEGRIGTGGDLGIEQIAPQVDDLRGEFAARLAQLLGVLLILEQAVLFRVRASRCSVRLCASPGWAAPNTLS